MNRSILPVIQEIPCVHFSSCGSNDRYSCRNGGNQEEGSLAKCYLDRIDYDPSVLREELVSVTSEMDDETPTLLSGSLVLNFLRPTFDSSFGNASGLGVLIW